MKTVWQNLSLLARRDRGGAILELAVGLPFLLLLAVGVADYARLYYTGIAVANAAQAGVYSGVSYEGDTDSMTLSAQRDGGSLAFDAITAGKFCRCPDTGVVNCATSTCGTYGVPQIFDSVGVRKNVAMLIRYVGLPTTVTVTRTAILRQR